MPEDTTHAGLVWWSWCWWKNQRLNCIWHHYSYHSIEILQITGHMCSLFKQASKKEDQSSSFSSAPLENFTPQHRSAVLTDFECHSPFALFHKKLNCNNNRPVSPKKQKNQKKNNSKNNNNNNANKQQVGCMAWEARCYDQNGTVTGYTGYMSLRCTYFKLCTFFNTIRWPYLVWRLFVRYSE